MKTIFIEENNKRIIFKQLIDAKDRFSYVNKVNEILKSLDYVYHIELMTMRSAKDFCFKIRDFDKIIYVYVKPSGKRSKINSHEFLTASLSLLNITKLPNNEKDILKIYSSIETLVRNNKIKNYTMSEVNLIEYDNTSLCQAVSASKNILSKIGDIPDIAYLTGNNKWDKDIEHLIKNLPHSYNSSDIIFKKEQKLFGVSLKRKELISSKTPPLINKSLLHFFNDNSLIKETLQNIISDYFIDILNQFRELNIIDTHVNKNNWKKIISNIDLDIINEKIKNDKCILWENIRGILFKNSDLICDKLIKYILRIELNNFKDFDFSLVTGIGRYKKNKGFIVETGEIISLDKILDIYNRYIKDKKYDIKRNKEKESMFQSTLFLTIFSENIPIINLEIRYKGRFHTSPEILAFFTPEFKEMLLC